MNSSERIVPLCQLSPFILREPEVVEVVGNAEALRFCESQVPYVHSTLGLVEMDLRKLEEKRNRELKEQDEILRQRAATDAQIRAMRCAAQSLRSVLHHPVPPEVAADYAFNHFNRNKEA